MKFEPLFSPDDDAGVLYRTPPYDASVAPSCSACPRSLIERDTETCVPVRRMLPQTGQAPLALPTMLVVASEPTANEQSTRVGFSSTWHDSMLAMLGAAWGGKVHATYASRCAPMFAFERLRRALTPAEKRISSVEQCRAHLVAEIAKHPPNVIVALGADAVFALQDFEPTANAPLGGHGFIQAAGRSAVPVIHLLATPLQLQSSFARAELRAYLARLATDEVDWYRATSYRTRRLEVVNATFVEVNDLPSAQRVHSVLQSGEFASFDTETGGRPWQRDFYVSRVSATIVTREPVLSVSRDAGEHRTRFHTFVWTGEELRRNAVARAALRELLTCELPKVGHNIKYDVASIASGFGWDVRPIESDTMVAARELNGDASAELESVAALAGIAGHKAEFEHELAVAQRFLMKAAHTNNETPPNDTVPVALMRAALRGVARGDESKTWAYTLVNPKVLTRYAARDALSTAVAHLELRDRVRASASIARVHSLVDMPAVRALCRIEGRGVAVSRSALQKFSAVLGAELDVVTTELAQFATDVEWSSTQQVAAFLYDRLKLELPKSGRFTSPRSTDEEALTALSSQHEVCAPLLRYRTLTKLDGTYATGMTRHIRDDGRIHASYNVAQARSGRMSASGPNLQNITSPSGDEEGKTPWGRLSRDVFASMTDVERVTLSGDRRRVLVARDESQLELRVAALLSGDEEMAALFRSGVDFHQGTADLVWGKGADKSKRKKAKIVNFALLFGKGDKNLARELGVSVSEARDIRAAILGKFDRLRRWLTGQESFVAKQGYVYTMFGGEAARLRALPSAGMPNEYARAEAYRRAQNTPIQGTASDIVTAALYPIEHDIRSAGLAAGIVATVHDQIMCESELWCAREVSEIMAKHMHSESNGVPFVTDLEVGVQWGSLTAVKTDDEFDAVLHRVAA